DGEAFNADDVVFTIQMLLDNAPALIDSAPIAHWVQGVRKIDDLTVEFTLTAPNPRFQLDYFSVKIWGSVNILPEHIWRGQDPLTFKNFDPAQGWPVFTGPYTLQRVSPTEFIYLRDDNWWGAQTGFMDLPEPKQLIWTWAGPEETRVALMADGQLDSLMDVTLGAFLALRARNPNVIAWHADPPYAWLDPCSRALELNTAVAPWNTREIRWALNHAINRDEIVAIAYEGTTMPSRHFFPAYPPLNRLVDLLDFEQFPLMVYDPERARALFEAQGFTLGADGFFARDGRQLALDIQTHEAFIEKQRIAHVVVEQLQRIGINATMRNVAGGTWEENFDFGNFEARVGWHFCGSVNEPWASMDTFNARWLTPLGERAPSNEWRWESQRYSELVDEIGKLPLGDPRIDALFVEAMGLWLADLPVIPVTQARKLIPFDTTYWTNWPTAENNYLHATTWWQSTHKIIHSLERATR
ncbi:MAG: ABC transporter substrate-binding protein, partial [Truepera sp.]|nr:ABC transporter substrate-binding protein [Truepera sp.]